MTEAIEDSRERDNTNESVRTADTDEIRRLEERLRKMKGKRRGIKNKEI